ncbi:MAG: YbaN family protein [Pigmentiphaga sp.]|uniref:YbaN family protein n=1 Tax=Pigmentiphaga sp. TaxID=1977564 RepID=UPI0029A281B2|nr:YbaN family protein [Pigmentiphaga sp.]MDX3907565.1 YbaN family protein [Pigmentiphaga sp.]
MQERPPSPHPNAVMRGLILLAALLCLALGVIGIFVPGLPTTIFILMAAWLAARGSPRLLAWLEGHPVFGPMLRNWNTDRSISRRTKWSAAITMAFCAAVLFIAPVPLWIAALASGIMLTVAVWLWLRPEPGRGPRPTADPGGGDDRPV